MKFSEFQQQVKDLIIFNLNDVRKLDPDFHRQQLNDWLERGFIKAIAGGYYALEERVINEQQLFMVANKVYEPSYVSLESALAFYQIIPETVLGVYCVSSRKTMQLTSNWGMLRYRSIKPLYMIGYEVIENGDLVKFSMAKVEKAVLDYLYLNPKINSVEDFKSLRWNKTQLAKIKNDVDFTKYLNIFENKALNDRVESLMRYLDA